MLRKICKVILRCLESSLGNLEEFLKKLGRLLRKAWKAIPRAKTELYALYDLFFFIFKSIWNSNREMWLDRHEPRRSLPFYVGGQLLNPNQVCQPQNTRQTVTAVKSHYVYQRQGNASSSSSTCNHSLSACMKCITTARVKSETHFPAWTQPVFLCWRTKLDRK